MSAPPPRTFKCYEAWNVLVPAVICAGCEAVEIADGELPGGWTLLTAERMNHQSCSQESSVTVCDACVPDWDVVEMTRETEEDVAFQKRLDEIARNHKEPGK